MTLTLRSASQARSVLGVLLIALSLVPAMAVPADRPFREGLSAYNSGDFQQAMKIWMPLAQGEYPALRHGQ